MRKFINMWRRARPEGFFYALHYCFDKRWRASQNSRLENKRKRRVYGSSWNRMRGLRIASLKSRDGNICCLCKGGLTQAKKTHPLQTTIDHIIPRSRGGSNNLENLQLLHLVCHDKKTYLENKGFSVDKMSFPDANMFSFKGPRAQVSFPIIHNAMEAWQRAYDEQNKR